MKDTWLNRTDHVLDFYDNDKKHFIWQKELIRGKNNQIYNNSD